MSDVRNKVAIITGGGSGIGKSICEVFVEAGATIHIIDSNSAAAGSTASHLTGLGYRAAAHDCDIALHLEVARTIARIAEAGPIDILVNNAGISHIGNLEKTTEDELGHLFSVNVKGAYNCMHACISRMKEQRSGVILNIASIAGMIGLADRFAYSMTKGAVLAMTYSVAKDYLAYKIRCNSISPARIHTPFVDGYLKQNYPGKEAEVFEQLSLTQPIGRMGEPRDVAQLALFLCSDDASFVTGANFPLDGGTLNLSVPG